jgi:hypothetical protein
MDASVAAAEVEVQEPMVWEASREGVMGAIQERVPQFKECYGGWAKLQPELSGHLKTEFVITTDPEDPERGVVSRVGVYDADLHHPFMEGCVLHVFEDLRFEPPQGGSMTVRHQMRFSKEPPAPPDSPPPPEPPQP